MAQSAADIEAVMASLAPPTATAAVKALSAASKFDAALWAGALAISDARRSPVDAALPFLSWELGLDEIAPWVPDLRRALSEGRAWQDERGTPAAVARAMGWIDAPLAAIEENPTDTWWDLVQLEMAAPMVEAALAPVVALSRLSLPAHSDVIRIYGGHDERAIDVDDLGEVDGLGLVDDWSGRWIRPDWPKLSFGVQSIAREPLAFTERGAVGIESVSTVAAPVTEPDAAAVIIETTARAPLEWVDRGWPTADWPVGGYRDDPSVGARFTDRDAGSTIGDELLFGQALLLGGAPLTFDGQPLKFSGEAA